MKHECKQELIEERIAYIERTETRGKLRESEKRLSQNNRGNFMNRISLFKTRIVIEDKVYLLAKDVRKDYRRPYNGTYRHHF